MALVEPAWPLALIAFGLLEALVPERMLVVERFFGTRSWYAAAPGERGLRLRRAVGALSALLGLFFLL